MKELGIIRRMFYRDGLSLSEIERRTGFTRKTIRHWLSTPEGTEPKYPRRSADTTKIAAFAAYLTQALEIDARRPRRDRRTALKLFHEIQIQGFTGDYSRVTEFIRRWRADRGESRINAFVPLQFELSEPFSSIRTPDDLRHHALIHSEWGLVGWRDWLRMYRKLKLDITRGLRFDRSFMAISAAVDGLGSVWRVCF